MTGYRNPDIPHSEVEGVFYNSKTGKWDLVAGRQGRVYNGRKGLAQEEAEAVAPAWISTLPPRARPHRNRRGKEAA